MLATQRKFLTGVLIALVGALCFSTKAIFVKLAFRDTNVDVITLLALRMIFSLPFFIAAAWVASRNSAARFSRKQWISVAFVGLMGYYVSSFLDFVGLQYVSAAIERLILFIYPTLVLLMSAVVYKQKVKPIQWLALIITYAGLLVAFFSEADFSTTQSKTFLFGSLMIFVCAFTYAIYIVGSGRLIPVVGATKFNSYAMSFACAGVLAHYFLSSEVSIFGYQPQVYTYGLSMALLSTVIPSFLVVQGIKRIGSNNAAIVGSIGPVSTLVLAYYFLNESVSLQQIFGTILILVGVLLISGQKQNNVTS